MAIELTVLSGTKPFGVPVGRCIYCGSDGGEKRLSDEHIIAYSLSSDAYLPKASCTKCAKKTSYLEGYAARQVFGPIRVHFRIQSRRQTIALDPIEVVFQTDQGEELRRVANDKVPPHLFLPIFEPPGLLVDKAPSPIGKFEPWAWHTEDAKERLRSLLRDGDQSCEIRPNIKAIVFARMLAKIAHATAVAYLGVDSFEHYLPPLILGEDENAAYFVGGAAPPTDPLPPIPYSKSTHHHTIGIQVMSSPGKPDIIAIGVRLFHHVGSPTYGVIVGKPLPAALERLRIKDTTPELSVRRN